MGRRKVALTESSSSSSDTEEYQETPRKRKATTAYGGRKRRKVNDEDTAISRAPQEETNVEEIWNRLPPSGTDHELQDFKDIIQGLLGSLFETRERHLANLSEVNQLGQKLRPITLTERALLLQQLQSDTPSAHSNCIDNLLSRKLKLDKHRREHSLSVPRLPLSTTELLEPLSPPPVAPPPDPSIIDALTSIETTPFRRSLCARLLGCGPDERQEYLYRDWEANSQWIDLMDDIHEHHTLAHPEKEPPSRSSAPIDYQTLRPSHLVQIHDLLERTFWPGVDVSDSLQYSPELCTVVATYKHLVVGAAFLSSPHELYITYLAVRPGWESSQIATKMLYTLLLRNPKRDTILHVSANSPAMLLYNRFGFKAEEFIVGFYEDYLDHHSRASKNAFRLRLRC